MYVLTTRSALEAGRRARVKKHLVTWIVLLSVAAVLVATGVWALRRPGEPDIKYETAAADRGRVTSHVTSSGTVSALVTVLVGSQVSGRVESLNATFNSVVKKGEVIAKIDPHLFEADVRKARANVFAASGNLAKAKAEADNAERQAVRLRALRNEGVVSGADLDTAESAAVAARAQVESVKGAVEQARASLYQAEVNLAYCTIRSPIDGVVISRSVDVGQTVAASLSAPTLFTIAEDLRKMQVDTFVAEADVGKLEPGKTATFTVDAFPGRRFKGVVREIRNAPQTVQNVVTYDAVIDVANPDLELKPGMTANVTILVAEKDDVLRIPNAALRYRAGPELMPSGSAGPWGGRPPRGRGAPDPSGATSGAPAPGSSGAPQDRPASSADGDSSPRSDRKMVWVIRDGRPQMARIRTGITDGTNTEVLEGDIEEGDQLVTSATGPGAQPTSTAPRGGGNLRRMF